MYSTKAGLIIGFHGCDKSVGEKVIQGDQLKGSENDYDWLGNGIYFWEGNASRALTFAEEAKGRFGDIQEPFVIGAILDLGYCLDLLDSQNLALVKNAYEGLKATANAAGHISPTNTGSSDKLIRKLDCAVIQYLHSSIKTERERPFDSVRGLFPEGKPLYEDAGFRIKDHIQICIRNPNCIKGYFLPREIDRDFPFV